MRRVPPVLLVLVLPLLLAGPVARPASAQSSPETIACFDHFDHYVEAIGTGNLERAATFWRPEDRAAAARLGIAHRDSMLLKLDSDSPIWRIRSAWRDSTADVKFGPAAETSGGPLAGTITLMLRVDEGADRRTKQYLFQPDGQGGWLLANRARWIAEQGPGTPGRYVRVYERRPGRSRQLPDHVIGDLDQAVARMAEQLEICAERMVVLEREKIDYLLAQPDVVEYLAGAPTVGVANLQVDMVVTHHPHHVHELAHLLVNVWLADVPLYTLPLLQEGLATHLGGQWGREARVLARVGRTSLRSGIVTLDEMLTRSAFFSLGADLTYAPAAVFAGWLLDEFGADGLRRVYLACSGTLDEVAGWSGGDVRSRIAGELGRDWNELADAFARSCQDDDRDVTLAPSSQWPGPVASPADCPDTSLSAGPYTLEAIECGADDPVRITLRCRAGPGRVAVLFGGADRTQGENPLFAEQVPGRAYRGETHVLLITPVEAKLYDLGTRMLVGLHSEGFWPSDDYATIGGTTLRFHVEAGLMPSLREAVIVPLDR
jgi:hypothetical protein